MSSMQRQPHTPLLTEYDAAAIARVIVDVAVDKKASDVTLMDIHDLTTLADFFVIATGTSERQLRALSVATQERMDEEGITLLRAEGLPSDGWILLDYGQVIVHLFAPEQRAYYDLERRWRDAPTLLRIQ
jgi:ribosome-associated protein